MDDSPVGRPRPFNQRPPGFYLKLLLLLLKNVMHNQSLTPHCPPRAEDGGFPNFTSDAGSPFFYRLPLPATLGRIRHCQLTLADGDNNTLPHWMVFRCLSPALAGLALTEECGAYHLRVSVAGQTCAADFYLHILKKTVTDKDPARDTLSFSEWEMVVWSDLLLQLNPATLDASRRLRLVSTVADHLRLPIGFVYLFSRRENFTQQQWQKKKKKKLRVCRRGGLAEKPDVSGDVAELLWPAGGPGGERRSILEHGVQTGGLQRLLGAPVFERRVLCAPGGLRRKVKRDLQGLKFVPTSTRVHQTERLDYSRPYSLPPKVEPSLSTFSLPKDCEGTELEPTHTESDVNSFGEEDLLQPSGTWADTLPERVFKLTPEDQAFSPTMNRPDIHPDLPGVISKTNHMQKIQVPSTSLLAALMKTFSHAHSQDVVSPGTICPTASHTSFCVVLFCSDPNRFSVHNSEECAKQKVTSDSSLTTSEYFWTTDCNSSPFLPERASTVRRFVGEPSADTALSTPVPSSTLHSVNPSPPLTPAPYSVTPALPHEAVDGASRASRLTLRPPLQETSLWTENHRANHTESQGRPTESSQGHFTFSQEPPEDHNVVKPTLHNLPSVPHRPLTETWDDDVLPLDSRREPTQSPPQSNKIPTARQFPDVSPTSRLTTGQLSITLESETAQHLSPAPPAMNQEVTSQMNVTTRDASSTTSTGPLAPSGQTELESSLATSLLEPSVTMLTPALPSELGLLQLDTSNIRNTVFSVESVKASPASISLLQTLSWSLLHDSDVSSLQQNLKSRVEMDFQSELATEVNFPPNGQTQTFISGTFLTSLSPVQRTKSPQITPVPLSVLDPSFEVGPSVKSTHQRSPFLPSMKPTLVHTLQLEESQQIEPVPESLGHFSATAPSTAQELRTTSAIHLMQSLEPSFPLCGPSVDHVLVSGCTPPIKSANLWNTTVPVLSSLTSYSPGEKHWTALPSPFFTSDSSGHFFSTQTSADYFPSGSSFSINTLIPTVGLSTDRRQISVRPSSSSSLVSNSLNLPPKALQSIPMLVATVGFPFLYSIPPGTFLDPEDGEADALSLEIRLIDGPPLSVGTWLALDGLELRGVPLEVDLQFAPQHLLLVARDTRGLSATLPLTLDLRRSPIEPCHVFTLTAQRSLRSILRHRRAVDLLLTKLSRFFNSSGGHQLSVVSVAPGSTVVSWYDRSMCETGRMKTTRCHADLIHGMWLAMVSAGGSVHPEFREAMLPEFPITKVGPVSYRRVCFPTTPPPTFGSSTPPVHTNDSLSPTSNTCSSASTAISTTSQQANSYRRTAAVLTALLVVCLLILIVLLVAAVLHFCKGRGGSRTVAMWPESRDRRAIRPRRPPLLQPELPPPPLRLWIDLTQDDGRPLPIEQGEKPRDKALQPRPIHYDSSHI